MKDCTRLPRLQLLQCKKKKNRKNSMTISANTCYSAGYSQETDGQQYNYLGNKNKLQLLKRRKKVMPSISKN